MIDIGSGQQANLNPTASAGIAQEATQSSNPYENVGAYSAGKAPAQGLLNDPSSFQEGLGGGNDSMAGAIKARSMQGFNIGQNQVDLSIAKQASADKLNALSIASQQANQEVLQNRQKAMLAYQIDQANKKARGQILGTILGITGGIGGGVIGGVYGGPTGAATGAQAGFGVGSGTGQMIGSGG